MEKETEVTLYAKIGDMSGLSKAKEVETHYQYECKTKQGKPTRVRLTVKGNDTDIKFTTKVKLEAVEGVHSNVEHNCKVDEEFVRCYKLIADHLLIKDRYVFLCEKLTVKFKGEEDEVNIDLPVIKFEVDVFMNRDGQACEWCKIDVEVDDLEKFIEEKYPHLGKYKLVLPVKELPFKPIEVILPNEASEAQKSFIAKLWSEEYRLPVEYRESYGRKD